MHSRSLLILIALAGASVIGAGTVITADQPVRSLPAGQKLFADLAAKQGQVTRIRLTQGKDSLTFEKKGDVWTLAEKSGYPVAPEKIRQILVDLTEVETLEAKTAKADLLPRLDLGEGDGSRARHLTLYSGETVLADVFLGKLRSAAINAAALGLDKPMLYLRKGGDGQAWLVESRLNPRVEALEYLTKDLFDIAQDKVASVTLTPAEGPAVEIGRAPGDTTPPDVAVLNPPEGRVSKKGWDVSGVVAALEGMSFEDVRPAQDIPVDGPATEARFTLAEGGPVVVTLRKLDGADWAIFSGENDALKPTQGWAFKLPSYKIERLTKSLADLTEEPKTN